MNICSLVRRLAGSQILPKCQNFLQQTTQHRCNSDFHDPPYLDSLKPPIPIYDELNLQIRGYDFAVLENFQSFIHKLAMIMDISTDESWGTPAVDQKIQRFKPNGTTIDSEYQLKIYERNLGLVDVPSTTCSVFVQAVQAALPQGIMFSLHVRQPEHSEIRYIPDLELKQLKQQLESSETAKKK